ncbi:MAG: 50S ribosomal protein L11 methyltransferase [Candidatus Riflebacteria bacterium]|nr:50S ribosomal protein L11 methyltransferase [Candidatus Riflebacteria bacterium]
MLRRVDLKVGDEFEDALLALANRLEIQTFSSPCIVDCPGGEEDFEFTGETVVSFIYSTVEKDSHEIERQLDEWLKSESPDSEKTVIDYGDNEDWMANFRAYFRPIQVSDKIIIRPPWQEPLENEQNATVILIDPGMAFGTGTHESTRLCLRLMENINLSGCKIVDLGAGSGILSFALLKMGAKEVYAIEIDGPAVENLRKNAKLNAISSGLEIYCKDLASFKSGGKFDGLTANISSPIILANLQLIIDLVKDNGWFIFSGINSPNALSMREAFSKHPLLMIKELTEGEWHGFLVEKKE